MFNLIRDLNDLKHNDSWINNKIVTRRENHTNENLFAKINFKKWIFKIKEYLIEFFEWYNTLKKNISDFDS
jgi:hypothetical protein